jgi:hypothetical protein
MIKRHRVLVALQAITPLAAVLLAWLTMMTPSTFVSAGEDVTQIVEGTWYGILDAGSIGGNQRLSVIATLTRDGRVVALDHGDLTHGLGLSTSALGSWVRTGRRRIALTALEFIHDHLGNLTGLQKDRGAFELTAPDTFTGTITVEIYPATQVGIGPDGFPQFEIVGDPLTDTPRATLGPFPAEFQRLRVGEQTEEDD